MTKLNKNLRICQVKLASNAIKLQVRIASANSTIRPFQIFGTSARDLHLEWPLGSNAILPLRVPNSYACVSSFGLHSATSSKSSLNIKNISSSFFQKISQRFRAPAYLRSGNMNLSNTLQQIQCQILFCRRQNSSVSEKFCTL